LSKRAIQCFFSVAPPPPPRPRQGEPARDAAEWLKRQDVVGAGQRLGGSVAGWAAQQGERLRGGRFVSRRSRF
jgi:hypothetical protein